jgi:peptide/nickel transport system substrate-binding protein
MTHPGERDTMSDAQGGITRADFLKRAGAAGTLVAMGDLLAACGGGGKAAPTGTTPSGPPRRGGHLRAVLPSGGTAETLDPGKGAIIVDGARQTNLFDGLVFVDQQNKLRPRLATEWAPSRDAMLWRVKLRQGVTWHDGKPFTADDVLYTMRLWTNPANFAHATTLAIDMKGLKKVNDHEIAIPLLSPNASLMDLFVYFNNMIVQDGAKDFHAPVGTGAFKFQSFTPGQRSVFVRNPDYWQPGKPHLDSLEIISIEDDGARINAVRGGQADVMSSLPYADARQAIRTNDKTIKVLDGKTPSWVTFYMDCSKPPFNDVRVRQAMKWAVDRQGLIDGAYSGFGTLGNDIPGKGLKFFADDLPQREQDIDKAKSLLKAAGHDVLPVVLTTAPGSAGQVQAATLLASQVAPAGFKVKLKQLETGKYFNPPPSGVYLTMSFAQDLWPTTSLQTTYKQLLLPGAPFPETHYRDPKFTKIVQQAIGTLDETKAADLWHQAQEMLYDEGGFLIHAQADFIDATAPNVGGLTPGGPIDMGGFPFEDAYLTSA